MMPKAGQDTSAQPPIELPTRQQCQLGFVVVIVGYFTSVMLVSMCNGMESFLFRYPQASGAPVLGPSQLLLAVSGEYAQTILSAVWLGLAVLYITWVRRTALRMLWLNAGLSFVLVFLLGIAAVATKEQVEATRQWRLNQKQGRTNRLPPAG